MKKIRKAVIPAGGFGTRLFPATKAVKKELLPIIDRHGRAKPIILLIVEELLSAGIEEIAIVVRESDRQVFANFFHSPLHPELLAKLSLDDLEYSRYLENIGSKIILLTQPQAEGFGHAVFCAKEWIGDETFVLSLGDHLYSSKTDLSCTQQLIEIYQQSDRTTIDLTVMEGKRIEKAGCVTGVWEETNKVINLTEIYEKPSLE
jgi:UTP--glucose-1-phosphate uridylyltransferase